MKSTPLRTLGLYNTEYEGQITRGGDTVYVSQLTNANDDAQLRTVGVDADSFNTKSFKSQQVQLTANKRAVSAYKWNDDVDLQTILNPSPKAIEFITNEMARAINTYLYSLVAPIAGNVMTGVTALNAAELLAGGVKAAELYWPETARKFVLCSPEYYADILSEEKFINLDYGADPNTVPLGLVVKEAYGWNVVQDNSLTGEYALGVNPDWLLYAEQTTPRFQVSNGLANDEFTIKVVGDMFLGAVLSNEGAKKHMTWSNP